MRAVVVFFLIVNKLPASGASSISLRPVFKLHELNKATILASTLIVAKRKTKPITFSKRELSTPIYTGSITTCKSIYDLPFQEALLHFGKRQLCVTVKAPTTTTTKKIYTTKEKEKEKEKEKDKSKDEDLNKEKDKNIDKDKDRYKDKDKNKPQVEKLFDIVVTTKFTPKVIPLTNPIIMTLQQSRRSPRPYNFHGYKKSDVFLRTTRSTFPAFEGAVTPWFAPPPEVFTGCHGLAKCYKPIWPMTDKGSDVIPPDVLPPDSKEDPMTKTTKYTGAFTSTVPQYVPNGN